MRNATDCYSNSDTVVDFDDGTSHTSVIREHYVFLLETLDVKVSGLVCQLYSDHVISSVERDDIGAEQTSFRANEKLLSVLSRKSPQQFQLFLDALDNCEQRHVRNVINVRPGATTVYTHLFIMGPFLFLFRLSVCPLLSPDKHYGYVLDLVGVSQLLHANMTCSVADVRFLAVENNSIC